MLSASAELKPGSSVQKGEKRTGINTVLSHPLTITEEKNFNLFPHETAIFKHSFCHIAGTLRGNIAKWIFRAETHIFQ